MFYRLLSFKILSHTYINSFILGAVLSLLKHGNWIYQSGRDKKFYWYMQGKRNLEVRKIEKVFG